MAEYPGTESETRIMPGRLREQVGRIFEAAGMGAEDADLLAASLVSTEPHHIHRPT